MFQRAREVLNGHRWWQNGNRFGARISRGGFYRQVRGVQNLSKEFEWQTVICSNGVIACWHPPKQFPFEHSRSFNMEKALQEKEKFLNRKTDETLCTMEPNDLALREIFYTEMQEWRPIYREKRLYKAKVDDELKPVLSNPLETPTAPVIATNIGDNMSLKAQIERGEGDEAQSKNSLPE